MIRDINACIKKQFYIPLGYKGLVPLRSTTAVRVGSSGKLGLVLQVVILRAYAWCIFLRKHNFARDPHEYLKSIHSQFDSREVDDGSAGTAAGKGSPVEAGPGPYRFIAVHNL